VRSLRATNSPNQFRRPRKIRKRPSTLRTHAAERPLIVCSTLDQLSDTDRAFDLSWPPVELPPNASFVVSALSGRSCRTRFRPARARLRAAVPATRPLRMKASILDAWLLEAGRS
jgi:hypothetical protein